MKKLTRYIHKGEPVYKAGDIKLTIKVDRTAFDRARAALRKIEEGQALRVLFPPDEKNVIDQE